MVQAHIAKVLFHFRAIIAARRLTNTDLGSINAAEGLARGRFIRLPCPSSFGLPVSNCLYSNKLTLGELIKKNRQIVPPTIDKIIEMIWGFSSEQGRHLREQGEPSFEEAELMLGLSASISTYLAKKKQALQPPPAAPGW